MKSLSRPKSTEKWKKYWKTRKIDWKVSYLDTWNHPHRDLLSTVLTEFPWMSLIEVGCGPGPNLVNIIKKFKGKQVGGIDVSPSAIELAKETFNGAYLKVGSVEDIMMSDNSTDVILSDMCLIYISPSKIDKAIKEIKRVARENIVFCEFHSESILSRLKLRFTSGYCAHNYKKLLAKHGFNDILIRKLPEGSWPGGEPQKTYGYIITAKIPKRK